MELLIVEIDHAYVGVPTSDVKEVVRAARISPAAGANANVKGLLNLRGKVVPVVAVRTLLGLTDRDIVSADHFVVLQVQPTTFAIHVDRAVEILNDSEMALDQAEHAFAASMPHAEFGVVHLYGARLLWTQLGLASRSGDIGVDYCKDAALP